MRPRAWSMTISVCTHTSPSGCHSGSCSQSMSAAISGHSRRTTPSSRPSAKPMDGRRACSSSFSSSPHTRSAGRSSSGMAAQIARVSCGTVELEPRGELQRAQHAQAVVGEGAWIDDPQHAGGEIGAPAERVLVRAGERVPRDRVDGEVAPPCRLAHRHRGIALDGETRVATPAPSTRVAAARRLCRRPCRRESCARPAPRGRTARAVPADRPPAMP